MSMPCSRRLLAVWLAAVGCSPSDATPSDADSGPPATTSPAPMVRINEIMSQNQSAWPDETFSYPDWIELWNPSAEAVDLTGWWLSDDGDDPLGWPFEEGTVLAGGGYLVVFCDEDPGALHASFHLDSDGGEDVVLAGPDATGNAVVDAVLDLAEQFPDVSLARVPDGAETWIQDPTSTPGEENTR